MLPMLLPRPGAGNIFPIKSHIEFKNHTNLLNRRLELSLARCLMSDGSGEDDATHCFFVHVWVSESGVGLHNNRLG